MGLGADFYSTTGAWWGETLPLTPAVGLRSLLAGHHEYLAVLRQRRINY